MSVVTELLAIGAALFVSAWLYAAPASLDLSFGGGTGATIVPVDTSGDALGSYCVVAGSNRFCMARLLDNGTLDTSFGTGDKVTTAIASNNNQPTSAMSLLPDGRVLLVGTCHTGNDFDMFAARYQSDGNLDTRFNTTGKRVLPGDGTKNEYRRAVAVQTESKIVIACFHSETAEDNFLEIRLLADGSFDTTFNTSGCRSINVIPGVNDQKNAAAVALDRSIVVIGTCTQATQRFCVIRLTSTGATDTTFNGNGKQVLSSIYTTEKAVSVAMEAGGRIVLGGTCSNVSSSRLCVMRLNPDGTPDSSFKSDGRRLAAGSCFNGSDLDFCVLAIEGGPLGYRNCSLDIDGDGQILATTGATIHARIALGMTGTAVVGSISFPSTATRTTWPIIRDYLISQCNVPLAR